MLIKSIFILSFLLSFFCESVAGQNSQATPDSIKVYKDIETFSEKHKGTSFIYKLFFRPVNPVQSQKSKGIKKNIVRRPDSKFEGKVIREINIENTFFKKDVIFELNDNSFVKIPMIFSDGLR